jgi:hypothetical protein
LQKKNSQKTCKKPSKNPDNTKNLEKPAKTLNRVPKAIKKNYCLFIPNQNTNLLKMTVKFSAYVLMHKWSKYYSSGTNVIFSLKGASEYKVKYNLSSLGLSFPVT